MKKLFNYLVIGFLIFVGITGVLIQDMEFIPDNAKVLVIPEYKTWIPNSQWANEIFQEQSEEHVAAKKAFDNKISTTYYEVKKGKYNGYELPETWNSNEGKERIYWGKKQSLLRSWILPKKNRWNKDGSWNW